MLLKTSFSYTKKFFQRTLQSFKSLLSGGYQRLPKTPPKFNPFTCGRVGAHPSSTYGELDKLCSEFADQWGYGRQDNSRRRRRRSSSKIKMAANMTQDEEIYSGSFMKFAKSTKVGNDNEIERREDGTRRRRSEKRGEDDQQLCCEGMEEERRSHLVTQKLRELEMMDMGNVDHVLDIEEVLHYYSRLTCPAYLHMVDKFFMDMCSEIFSPATPSAGSHRPPTFQP